MIFSAQKVNKDLTGAILAHSSQTKNRGIAKAPRIAAVILAAGASSRAAPHNKLLFELPSGRTLIETTLDHVIEAGLDPIILVTGHDSARIRSKIGARHCSIVEARNHAEGMAESLKSGIAALPVACAAVLICLGDMPLVTSATIRRIVAAYDPEEGRAIIIPTHRGKRGNPILWDRRFFPEILRLSGDTGGRSLFARHLDEVTELPIDDDSILRDFDTIEALKTLERRA